MEYRRRCHQEAREFPWLLPNFGGDKRGGRSGRGSCTNRYVERALGELGGETQGLRVAGVSGHGGAGQEWQFRGLGSWKE